MEESFSCDALTGTQLSKLVASDRATGAFGHSVAISGNTALIGANGEGASYLFDISNPLAPQQRFKWSNTGGFSVALSGNRALVSSYSGGIANGTAYLFDTITGAQLAQIDPRGGFERFGYSVGLSGNLAVIGAISGKRGGTRAPGAALLFDVSNPNNIQQLAKFSSDAVDLDNGTDSFGGSVAISGSTILAGAYTESVNGNSGGAYTFHISGLAVAAPEPGTFALCALPFGMMVVLRRHTWGR